MTLNDISDSITLNSPFKGSPGEKDSMPLLDHLEEFRWRLIKGFCGLLVGVIIAFFFSDYLVNSVMLGPTHADFVIYEWIGIDAIDLTLQSRKLPGQFFTYWGTVILMGSIAGSPVLFYQLWAFVEPALDGTGKWKSRMYTLFISGFFLAGVCFGYFVLVPFALQFFTQFQISEVIHNDFDINEYFSSLSMWVFSCGVVFQLPVISYFLSRLGLLNPDFLIKYRRHAIVTCFLVSAFLTPPDPISQVLVGIPLIMLYQFSIWVSRIGISHRRKSLRID